MNPTQSSQKPIQLQWDGGSVVITPEDEDRFVKDSQWAIGACQGRLAVEKFFDQFMKQFLARVRKFCVDYREKIYACYVPQPTTQVCVFIIGAAKSLDFELSDLISDLEIELSNAGWPADIVQLPNTSAEMLRSFFDPSGSIQVYGNAGRAPIEGGSQPSVP